MAHSAASPSVTETSFILRRLHSLTGIIPLGVFLLFHFFENSSVRRGGEAFNEAVVAIGKMPYLYAVEILGLLAPLVFHAVYGLFIRTPSRPNVAAYSYGRNWAYFFQRATGVIAFVYITFHVIATRGWALFVKGQDITYSDMHQHLSNNGTFLLYVLGILAVTYHFANGIWSFSITWGLVVSRKAQQRLALLTMLFFVVLAVVGLDIAWTFRTERSFLAALGL